MSSAKVAELAMCCTCAISHRMISICRSPPVTDGSTAPSRCGQPLRLGRVAVETEIEHFGARRGAADRGVGVQADEEVGLVVVGKRRAIVVVDGAVVVAREQHAHAEPGFERGLEQAGDRQRDVLLERAAGPLRALVVAAVPRVDHDGADRRERADGEQRWGRRRRHRRQSLRARRGGPDNLDDQTLRGSLDGLIAGPIRRKARAELDANRGCVRELAHGGDQLRRDDRADIEVERLGLESDDDAPGLLEDGVRGDRRGVDDHARVWPVEASTRTTTRGTRTPPTSTRREAGRTSSPGW